MKTTSDHHGYQIKIHTAESYYLWSKGKVYKTRKAASEVVGKITCNLDDKKLSIPDFRYCEIIEWFA